MASNVTRACASDGTSENSHPSHPDLPDHTIRRARLSKRSRLLRRISSRVLGLDNKDGEVSQDDKERDEPCFTNVVTYLEDQVTGETRANIANYLASHDLELCRLTLDNVHHYYHVAACLQLKQLREHCLNFCFHNNQIAILKQFEGCDCRQEIERESRSGYQRSISLVSNSEETGSPQYYIVFSDSSQNVGELETKPRKRKNVVMVIDMSNRQKVYDKRVEKMQQFGEGFASCSCEVNDSPYIFVSGGRGKSNQMWRYDVLLDRWSKCAKMIHGRSLHMMVSAGDDSIVVLGGEETACIEEYAIAKNKWRERVLLLANVKSSAAISVNGKIYVFGGETPAGPVATAQCYDVMKHEIERLPYLPCQFKGGRCVTFKDKIFIATDERHMICFDPETGSSSLCSQQPVLRRHFGMFVKNDRIYLIGGVLKTREPDESGDVSDPPSTPQYRYNPEKDAWVEKCKLCDQFPVSASCMITYPKQCSVVPFYDRH